MQLKYLAIGKKAVKFGIVLNVGTDKDAPDEERKVSAHEEPLPELSSAYAKLAPVVASILEVKGWEDGVIVEKLTVSETKQGTRSVKIGFSKQLDCRSGDLHRMETPFVQIEKPADGESGSVQVDKKHADLIKTALHEAERYAKGERSQQLLDFDANKKALQAQANKGGDLLDGTDG